MTSWAEAVFVLIGALTAAIVTVILILVVAFMIKIGKDAVKKMIADHKRKKVRKNPEFDQKAFMRDVEHLMDINYSLTYAEAEEIIKYIRRNTK